MHGNDDKRAEFHIPQADGQVPLPQAARKIEENEFIGTGEYGVPMPQSGRAGSYSAELKEK